ncbi:hypothetical protein L218DRAFT_810060, partial [Marasmius fiardii PR-910]
AFRRIVGDLPKKHTSLIMQLIMGHTSLNQYLHRFNIVEELTCPGCNEELETVSHHLLCCPAYTRAQ